MTFEDLEEVVKDDDCSSSYCLERWEDNKLCSWCGCNRETIAYFVIIKAYRTTKGFRCFCKQHIKQNLNLFEVIEEATTKDLFTLKALL